MEQLILLLQERNTHLERFYELNSERIGDLAGGEFAGLEEFYGEREHILSMIRHIDKVLEREQDIKASERILPQDRVMVQGLLDDKDSIVKQILAQDLQILSIIEQEKSSLLKDLITAGKGRKAMGSYKLRGGEPPEASEK